MKIRCCSVILAVFLLICLSAAALANGSIHPWPLDVENDKWGPVPPERLHEKVFFTNGNLVSKYHKQTGVLYHSYHGNQENDSISDQTFTNIIIDPPEGAVECLMLNYDGISLTNEQTEIKYFYNTVIPDVHDEIASPAENRLENVIDDMGPPYYEFPIEWFEKNEDRCTPIQLASQDGGNLYLAAWYDQNRNLICVDWLVETWEDFSVERKDLQDSIAQTCQSEDDLPDVITEPILIDPPTENDVQLTLVMYYYPSYRGNTDFAEFYLLEPTGLPVSDFDGSVVIYWPYPQGYTYSSPVHYQLKHYLDNTRTKFEILEVTPMPKGLRFVTDSFSPFELTWNEWDAPPETGDSDNLVWWTALCLLSIAALVLGFGRKEKQD